VDKTDQQLVLEYLNGNNDSFEKILNRYLKPVFNFIYRFSGGITETEDLTQETFFKAWKYLKKFDPEENFKTWLFTIARNTAIDFLRKKKNFSFSDFNDDEGDNLITATLFDPDSSPIEDFKAVEKSEVIERLLNKLSPKYREVLLLHYNHDLTFDEIGKILKKPLDTVKSQHRRALIALKKMIDAPK